MIGMSLWRKERYGRVLRMLFTLCMVIGMGMLISPIDAKALKTRTDALNINSFTSDESNADEGWSWNNTALTLTLENGFTLNYTAGLEPAITINPNSTIILKGNAVINSNNKGIETTGNLTVKSEEGVNGYLEINLRAKGSSGVYYYGVDLVNPDGESGRKLTITDNSILKIDGSLGDGCIFCSALKYVENTTNPLLSGNQIVPSENHASLEVTEKSAVQLIHGTSVASGFNLKTNMSDATNERVLFINGSAGAANPTLEVKSSNGKDISTTTPSYTNITMLSCSIEGTLSGDNAYNLTYNGTDHPILLNLDKTLLKEKLGIDPIKVTPANFTYYVSSNSEYLNNTSDYREKEITAKETQYNSFDYEKNSELINAATYTLSYNNLEFATFKIDQREVEINGLKAVDKVYDGSDKAAIDYSGMTTVCTNVGTNTVGIVDADKNADGSYIKDCITPCAKAYFLTLYQNKGTGNGIEGLFNDAKTYYISANVEYVGGGTAALSDVAVKQVYIDNNTDTSGIAIGITLGNPNYKVHVPSSDTNVKKSQIQCSAKIKPRSLTNTTNVSYTLSHETVKYRKDGYTEGKDATADIYVTITDKSSKTASAPEGSYTPYTLVPDVDYIMNPNVNKLYEVDEYEIEITGDGNYTGTIKPKWSIERAVREVTINTADTRIYDGSPYTIAANTGATDTPDFNYIVNDKSNELNVTGSLEDNSNLLIAYNGTANDGTVYTDSLTAPKEAGTYTVSVSVKETTHYTAASASKEFTIYKRTVALDWFLDDGEVDANTKRPDSDAITYNGKDKNYRAVVTNAVTGETVNVDQIVYNGTAKDGKAYNNSTTAPKEASDGNYSVKATKLSDENNYTLEDTKANPTPCPAHNFTVEQKEISITYDLPEKPYTYDATEHIPTWEVGNLVEGDTCKVTDYSLLGKDVFDADYTKATKAINATKEGSAVTITATAIDNTNYKLPALDNRKAEYKIVPLELTSLTVGTWNSHAAEDGLNIWAAKTSYTGALQEPKIMWDSPDGEKELKNNAPKRTKYDSYTDAQKDVLVGGYNASLSTEALAYSNKTLSADDSLKGYYVEITGTNNFAGTIKIPWNVEMLESKITITNYEATGTTPYTVTYGTALPEIEFTYTNEDIRKDSEKKPEEYVEYTYTGIMKNGKEYGKTDVEKKAPTEAGEYEVTATLEGTQHYTESKTTKKFIIAQKPVTILSDVTVYDKEYDGSDDAQLDFTGFKEESWDGLLDKDKAAVKEALSGVAKDSKGYITYTAKFAADDKTVAKDVKWGKDKALKNVVEEKDVNISAFAIDYAAITAENKENLDVLSNYVIASTGNPSTAKAKITPRQIGVSGITAKDKVYNGSKDVELVIPDNMIDGVVKGEKLSLNIIGEFKDTKDASGKDVAAKDVLVDGGKPAAKTVSLIYDNDSITAGDDATIAANYKLKVKVGEDGKVITDAKGMEVVDDTAVQQTTNATITPATLKINGVKAENKTYDGTPNVTLVWDDKTTSITGVCSGDAIELDNTVNSGAVGWTADSYSDADVAVNKYDEVIDKTGTITSAEYDILAKGGLKGVFNPDNYKVADITYTGKINPKKISGITWSFDKDSFSDLAEDAKLRCSSSYTVDKKNLEQIPKAAFETESGISAGELCEPVVKYYSAADTEFANPINEVEISIETVVKEETTDAEGNTTVEESTKKTPTGIYTPLPYLEDNGEYVAKVVSTTNANYVVDETAGDLTKAFVYDSEADSSDLAITNYQRVNNKPYTVTYGEVLDEVELSYNNSDIDKEDAATKASHFTYRYTGKALNGESYDSDKAPVNAGSYKLTVALEATEHYAASEASTAFIIEPRSVIIIQGVSVEDKVYNGTDKATLNFKNIVFDDIIASDDEAISKLFAENPEDYIRYKATFESKDVNYNDDNGTADRKVTGMNVAAGDYSFIYTETTPAILYNYSIAKEGNMSSLYGKIMPRPITVTGIKAVDKQYDGNDNAELDITDVQYAGRLKGDTFTIEAEGKFTVTGDETKASDVTRNKDGAVVNKNVSITIKKFVAGDDATLIGNYCLADEGQQNEATAKITPIEFTSAKWIFDEKKNLPTAVFDNVTTGGASSVAQLKYYTASDTTYKNPIEVGKLNAGDSYVARIEGCSDINCQVSDNFKNPIYPFVYGKKTETAEVVAKKAPTDEEKAAAVLALDDKLSLTLKSNKLTFNWGTVKDIDGYKVYTATAKNKFGTPVKVTKTSYTYSVNKNKYNYVYAEAYRIVDGKEVVVGKSKTLIWSGSKTKGYNAKSVKVKKKKLTVKVKKKVSANASIKVTRTVNGVKKTSTIKGKKAYLTYWSTNKKIATVSSSGKIKGVKKGSCYIYAMARNGKKQKIKVTVK
ncbi:MAG: hypothetical protein IJ232_03700 [Lachnospiraceae bacterium]|nr:hypothetical protein [Lachnospiraceae bacterium]